jgi:hypothetical protein
MQSCTYIQERIKKLGNLIRKRIHVFSSEYVHLHRNTRPDPHSAVMLQSIFSHLAKEPLHQYPDLTRLYTRLREWLGRDFCNRLSHKRTYGRRLFGRILTAYRGNNYSYRTKNF